MLAPGRSVDLRTLPVVLVSAGFIALYGFDGGAYDLVVRQELAIAVLWILAIGMAFAVLPRDSFGLRQWLPSLALLLLAGWTAASLAWTGSDERTVTELARVLHHAAVLGLVVAVLRRRWARPALIGTALGGVVVCLGALVIRFSSSALGSTSMLTGHRLSEPLGYWNAVGAWCAITAAILLGVSSHAREAWLRAAALAPLPAVLVAGYLAYSRGFYASVAIGAVVVVLAGRNRWLAGIQALLAAFLTVVCIVIIRGQPGIANGTSTTGAPKVVAALVLCGAVAALITFVLRAVNGDRWRLTPRHARRVAVASAAFGLIALCTLATAFGPRALDEFRQPVIARSADPAARLTSLNGTRSIIWGSALRSFDAHPIVGTGAGTFEFWWDRDGRHPEFVRDAHSLPLEAMAELGLPGLACIVLFAATSLLVLISALRAARSIAGAGATAATLGAFCAYLVSAGIDWMWEATAVTTFALVSVGCAAASLPRIRRRWLPPFRITVAVVALAGCVVELPGAVMTSDLRRSQNAAAHGDLKRAITLADEAASAQPWAASPYVQQGLLAEAAGDLTLAHVDLNLAQQREPTNWRIPLLLARVEAERGRPRLALRQYVRARYLRPQAAVFHDRTP